MTDLADLSIEQASNQLAGGHITCVALVAAVLDRLYATEPTIHAYAHIGAEQALARAKELDREPRRSRLHGIPYAVKDTLETKSLATEAGSAVLKRNTPTRDASVVAQLHTAGAVLIGKHTTHEFAFGHDPTETKNAWDLDRIPGGSSTGGGPSVAVGSAMFAIGTDAGGSTRVPASLNGVVGLKPTYGLVSTVGTVTGASVPGLEHIAVFARSIGDASIVLQYISGNDPQDVRTAHTTPFVPSSSALDVGNLRIGLVTAISPGQLMTSEVSSSLKEIVEVLEHKGVAVSEFEVPSMSLASPALALIVSAAVAIDHRHYLRSHRRLYNERVRRYLELAMLIPAAHIHAAERVRATLRREIREPFTAINLDVLIMPTVPHVAPRTNDFDSMRDMAALTAFTSPWNLVGLPAITFPCGFSEDGLPLGIQIVGRPYAESKLLQIAEWIAAQLPQRALVPPTVRCLVNDQSIAL